MVSQEYLKEGVLEVQNTSVTLTLFPCCTAEWEPFYFVLTNDDHLLRYNASKEGERIGIPMAVYAVHAIEIDAYTFEILVFDTCEKTFVMRAPSGEERDDWVARLSRNLPSNKRHYKASDMYRYGSDPIVSVNDIEYTEVNTEERDEQRPHSPTDKHKAAGSKFSFGLLHKMLN